MADIHMETCFYPWIRKGLGCQINEEDNLGNGSGDAKKRPTVQLTSVINASGIDDAKETIVRTESKSITLSGPGDVLSLNLNAILRVFPTMDSEAFPVNEFPYVEFWEPDFAWRFTPAKANEDKIRPWLTLVVCKASECSLEKASWGGDLVTFNVEYDEEYKKIFPLPTDVWKMAHAQGQNGQNAEFCRILGMKYEEMEENVEYRAFLIPVFEIGRLRGIRGPDYDENMDKSERSLNNFSAQTAAWEESIDAQREKHELPLTFPSYYSWNFKTGSLSFVDKVRSLECNNAKKSGIAVDVTSLGEGLDYAVLEKKPVRNKINMPAALTTIDNPVEKPFPMPSSGNKLSDENEIYDNLSSLLSKSPIFEENAIIKKENSSLTIGDNDDPWITPPIYGGKHILATSLDEGKNSKAPWLNQVNMDLHYRAAAGLGKKAVQRNQEELVNRAWKQIDAVKTLNDELNQKMLSVNVCDSVKYLNYGWADSSGNVVDSQKENDMVALMMKNLSLMKSTKFGKDGISLMDVMKAKEIPDVFASASFRNTAQKILDGKDDSSIFKSIAEGQWYQSKGLSNVNTLALNLVGNVIEAIKPRLMNFFVQPPSGDSTKIGPWTFFKYSNNTIVSENLSAFNNLIDSVRDRSERVMRYWVNSSALLAEIYKIKTKEEDLIKNKFWEITTLGKTDGGKTIYALDDAVFRELFFLDNNSKITIVKFNSVYYINRDYASTNVKFFRANSNDPIDNSVRLGVATLDGKDAREYYLNQKNKKIWNDSERSIFIKLAFTVIPDSVKAPDDFWVSQNYLEYKDAWEFYEDMVGKVAGKNKEMYDAWVDLKKFINEKYSLPGEPIKEKKFPSAIKQVSSLKDGLRDDSAYERLQECADTYYRTFFASGELRENYLVDCLASKYPIKAYPIFPEPAYYYLKDLADEFILPGIEDLPEDSISMFKGNAAFIESYLCGMNTEMGRELLWREYPTDQRGSYFKKFWDSETTIDDIKTENYFDINSIHRWNEKLGGNHVNGKNESNGKIESKGDLLFFAIKSKLMVLYPDTRITLVKAYWNDYGNKFFIKKKNEVGYVVDEEVLEPVSQAFVRDDVYVVGFKIRPEDALGSFYPNGEKNSGYMLTFEKTSENIEFKFNASESNTSAEFASNCVERTSIVGKHIVTLIGKN